MTYEDLKAAEKIMDVLSADAVGRRNAMTREELNKRLRIYRIDIEDRHMRSVYATLPICSCEEGLFVPETTEEVLEFEDLCYRKLAGPVASLKIMRLYNAYPWLAPQPAQVQQSLPGIAE